MKLKRLLVKVEEFLSAQERKRRADKADMREVLHKLKKKERKLKAQVAQACDESERARLQSRLKVVHAQRRKGIAAIRALDGKDA
jgi:hypothetical protein